MKKILLLSSLIAVMFSCSDEAEQTPTQNNVNVETTNVTTNAARPLPTIENATDEMFHAYVSSTVYKNIRGKIKIYNQKLNLPEGLEFSTIAERNDWIYNNMSSTYFLNLDESITLWNEIVSLQIFEHSQFPNVYQFINQAPEELVVSALNKWLNWDYLPTQSTSDVCDKKFDACTATANFLYFVSSRSLSGNDEYMADARAKQDRALQQCSDSYIKCVTN